MFEDRKGDPPKHAVTAQLLESFWYEHDALENKIKGIREKCTGLKKVPAIQLLAEANISTQPEQNNDMSSHDLRHISEYIAASVESLDALIEHMNANGMTVTENIFDPNDATKVSSFGYAELSEMKRVISEKNDAFDATLSARLALEDSKEKTGKEKTEAEQIQGLEDKRREVPESAVKWTTLMDGRAVPIAVYEDVKVQFNNNPKRKYTELTSELRDKHHRESTPSSAPLSRQDSYGELSATANSDLSPSNRPLRKSRNGAKPYIMDMVNTFKWAKSPSSSRKKLRKKTDSFFKQSKVDSIRGKVQKTFSFGVDNLTLSGENGLEKYDVRLYFKKGILGLKMREAGKTASKGQKIKINLKKGTPDLKEKDILQKVLSSAMREVRDIYDENLSGTGLYMPFFRKIEETAGKEFMNEMMVKSSLKIDPGGDFTYTQDEEIPDISGRNLIMKVGRSDSLTSMESTFGINDGALDGSSPVATVPAESELSNMNATIEASDNKDDIEIIRPKSVEADETPYVTMSDDVVLDEKALAEAKAATVEAQKARGNRRKSTREKAAYTGSKKTLPKGYAEPGPHPNSPNVAPDPDRNIKKEAGHLPTDSVATNLQHLLSKFEISNPPSTPEQNILNPIDALGGIMERRSIQKKALNTDSNPLQEDPKYKELLALLNTKVSEMRSPLNPDSLALVTNFVVNNPNCTDKEIKEFSCAKTGARSMNNLSADALASVIKTVASSLPDCMKQVGIASPNKKGSISLKGNSGRNNRSV